MTTDTNPGSDLDIAMTGHQPATPPAVVAAAVAYLRRRGALDVAEALGIEVEG